MTKLIHWAGSEDSHRKVEAIFDKIANASPEVLKQASDWEDDEDEKETEHYLLECVGGVAIINIRGALIDGSAGWWGRYYDIVGYDDIRNAIVCAVNGGAQQILVHIMSPGGQVIGIGSLSDFLKETNALVPITFFADSFAASGGVWLATSTGAFYASRHAEVGSVGVIAVAAEYTEMDKQWGIKRKVFKSTPLKASGNPNEKLDEANAAEIQRGVDESAQRFIDHIASSMGLSSAYVADNLATGQVWYADEAKRLGLVTDLTTFEELLVDLQNKVTQNNQNSFSQVEAPMAQKRKLIKAASAEEAMALAASGIPVTSASDSVEGESEDREEDTPTEEQNDDEEENAPDKSEEAAAAPADKTASSEMTTMLMSFTEKLAAAQVEVATLKAEAAATNDKLSNLQAIETQLKTEVAKKIQHNLVGAGAPKPSLESLLAMTSEQLLVQASAAEAALTARFGNGGQHAVVTDSEADEETQKAEALAKYSDEIMSDVSRIFSK